MPRKAKPARAIYRADRDTWYIQDRSKQVWTGVRGSGSREAAEKALAEYISTKSAPSGPTRPENLKIGQALSIYANGRGPYVADPQRLGYAIKALAPFWADLTCDMVKAETCRRYARKRKAGPSTVRRELGALQAALNYCVREGALISAPVVTLPARGAPVERWLTREEVDKLLAVSSEPLRRFIWIAVFTGTRKAAILNLRWTHSLDTGWVDLRDGVIHRKGEREAQTAKKRGSVRMPAPLQKEMETWDVGPSGFVIEWRGKRIDDIKKSFARAVARAGIDHATPHDLKRTAVTWAFQRGMTMAQAVEYFSTSQATLERTYRQHSPEHQRDAADIMGRD